MCWWQNFLFNNATECKEAMITLLYSATKAEPETWGWLSCWKKPGDGKRWQEVERELSSGGSWICDGEREVVENAPVNLKKIQIIKFERVSRDTGAKMEEGEEGGCRYRMKKLSLPGEIQRICSDKEGLTPKFRATETARLETLGWWCWVMLWAAFFSPDCKHPHLS